jgi:hypothetical protein
LKTLAVREGKNLFLFKHLTNHALIMVINAKEQILVLNLTFRVKIEFVLSELNLTDFNLYQSVITNYQNV